MKPGTNVQVHTGYLNDGGKKYERATVTRITRSMQPLPRGYVPVQFEADGAKLLVHVGRMLVVN